jgi:hypothetical protein
MNGQSFVPIQKRRRLEDDELQHMESHQVFYLMNRFRHVVLLVVSVGTNTIALLTFAFEVW